MAKKTRKTQAQASADTLAGVQEVKLSTKTAKAIDAIRGPFSSFTTQFAVLATSREELAPKFMKAFGLWQAETGSTFVEFVRMLDPTVGQSRDEYRSHRAYQAADYLRRLQAGVTRRDLSPTERAERIAIAPVSPQAAMARVLASLVPLISTDQLPNLWRAVQEQLRWGERQVARLQTMVDASVPLVQVRAPKGMHVAHNLRVVQPTTPTAEGEAA